MTTPEETRKALYVVFHQACKHPVLAIGAFSDAVDTARQCGMWASVREASDEDLLFLMRPGSAMRCGPCVGLLHKAAFAHARSVTGAADAKIAMPQFAADGSFDHLNIVSEDGTVEVS